MINMHAESSYFLKLINEAGLAPLLDLIGTDFLSYVFEQLLLPYCCQQWLK